MSILSIEEAPISIIDSPPIEEVNQTASQYVSYLLFQAASYLTDPGCYCSSKAIRIISPITRGKYDYC